MEDEKRIVFYDGDCGFCNRSVNIILASNKTEPFIYFASLQSDFSRAFFHSKNEQEPNLNSIVFYEEGEFYAASTAILKIAHHLKGKPWLKIGWIVPKKIRDMIYFTVAKQRKRLPGDASCHISDEATRKRFLA
jgi:predicted DCC family thiol-disulfide oxidoreductase YuxK